jgi:hypothetical protein
MITSGVRRDRAARALAATEQLPDDAEPRPVYFTDGTNLYRVVRWLDRPAEPRLAEVENCRSLDRVLLTSKDLARIARRVVPVAAS